MSFFDKLRGTIETIFKIGIGGPQLKNNAGVIESRNATDAGFVKHRGADAVAGNDFVTFQQLAAGGVTGPVIEIRFATALAATTDSVATIPANARVISAEFEVVTAYTALATVSIGQAGSLSLLQATTDNNPQGAVGNIYGVDQDTAWGGSALAVRATIAGAPAVGAGVVIVRYVTPSL